MKKYIYFLSFIIIFTEIWTLSILAQVESSTAQVFKSIYNDTSPPLREIPEAPLSPTPWKNGIIPLLSIDAQFEDRFEKDQSLQEIMGSRSTTSILQNWDGVSAQGYAPPDPTGDVGPNHYMEAVNVRFQIWNKTGTSLLGPLNLGTIWSGFPGPWASSLNDGDPIVLYDEAAGRFFIAQFSLPNYPNGPFYILIAVSQTGDPTGSWHRYGFSFTHMPDYPKFGIWPDGYYMSANSFSSGSLNYNGTYAAAFDRSQMLTGNAATMVSFLNSATTTWSLLPSDWNGTNTPPNGAPNYFGQIHDNSRYGGSDGFDIYSFSVNWTTPGNSTFTGPSLLTTSPFSTVDGIPQQGTSTLLDDLSVMTMNRLDYRNFGTHQSMVVCHTVDAGSDRAGMRWYEFRKTGGSWSIYQQGTYAPADGLYRWMGSIAINAGGDIALGYSVSSSSMYPAIRYTGRLSGDTPGVMTIPEETIQAGLGSQTGLYRWGDYTQMVVDPDGSTFWYVNQYQPSTGSYNWNTRIASLSFGPPCPVAPPFNPNPTNGASSVSINVPNISWTNGSGATQCEVWFGTTGNMTKRYDGNLISSWTLPTPLNYNNIYNWQIIDKNGSCSVSGPLWSFTTEQNPNLVVDTAIVYPQNSNYWTGTCNSSTKTQVSLVNAGGNNAGWMAFNISPIPDDATIISVIFYGYLYANNYPYWSITPMGSVNPVTASAAAIYNQVSNNYSQGTAYSYNQESGTLTNGWINRTLGTTAPSDLQTRLGQNWFAIGIVDWDFNASYYVNFQGWAETNKPYLKVVYEYINVTNPINVTATPTSDSQINIDFTPNAANNNVVIVWNLTGTFMDPSGPPPAVGQPFSGGTLLYNGTTSPVFHTDLNQLTTYYYKVFSYNGTKYSPGIAVNATTLAAQTTFQLTVNVTNGWNMVSIPGLNTPDQNVTTWWPGKLPSSSVFKFNGTYQPVTTATPGEGYWMKNNGIQVYNTGDEWPAGGIQIVPHNSIQGMAGWNMIGGYETTVATSGIQTDPPGLCTGTVFGFNGIYVPALNILPGYGYWIKLTGPGQIIIPETLSKGTEVVEYIKEDWGRISITDASGKSNTLYGVKGQVDLNNYELPPALSEEMFDVRYGSGRLAEDISSGIQTIEMSGIEYPLTVRVENMDIRLQDETGKQLNVNLKSGEDIVISDATITKLMVSGELIPTVYALEQNYPNPFNPSTNIEFSLPENVGNVKLSIYNTLGEKVAELVNTALTAGKYSYQWNAQNVATGMYIYELRTDKFVSVKKMMLVK